MVQENPKEWKCWLPLAEFWYNFTFHTVRVCSPFKALYGHDPNLGALPPVDETSPVARVLTDRAAQVELLKQHLTAAHNRMKIFEDSKRSKRVFEVGDKVLLKLQPYAQTTVVNHKYPKLAYKYFGPYKILEKFGQVAYRLELPVTSQVHDVFHVSQIKEFRDDYTPMFADLPKTPALDVLDTSPEKVLDQRLVKKGNAAISSGPIYQRIQQHGNTGRRSKQNLQPYWLGDKLVLLGEDLSHLTVSPEPVCGVIGSLGGACASVELRELAMWP